LLAGLSGSFARSPVVPSGPDGEKRIGPARQVPIQAGPVASRVSLACCI
jgi:hypothetical protein